jgi:hypothetical protein
MVEGVITQEQLKDVLDYDPDTGIFTWKKPTKSNYTGKIAGYVDISAGYNRIRVYGKKYRSHRLAWLYMYGVFPAMIDHINCIKDDNRISNLRECTTSQNSANRPAFKNNKSGLKGVYFHEKNKKWEARINVNKKLKYLGCFLTKEEAYEAYCKVAKEHHGEFFNAG